MKRHFAYNSDMCGFAVLTKNHGACHAWQALVVPQVILMIDVAPRASLAPARLRGGVGVWHTLLKWIALRLRGTLSQRAGTQGRPGVGTPGTRYRKPRDQARAAIDGHRRTLTDSPGQGRTGPGRAGRLLWAGDTDGPRTRTSSRDVRFTCCGGGGAAHFGALLLRWPLYSAPLYSAPR